MRAKNNLPSTVASDSSNQGEKTIPRPWLRILRAAWLVTALAAWLVFGLSIVVVIRKLQGVGDTVIGLISILTTLLCLVLAGLLFWRKSEQRMSLLIAFFLLDYGIIFAGPEEVLLAGIGNPALTTVI